MNAPRAKSYSYIATRVITVQLVGSDTAIAEGVTGFGSCPVLDLCRKLIVLGYDPNLALIAMRDGKIALRVRSIGQAGKLSTRHDGIGFERFRPGPGSRPSSSAIKPRARRGVA